MQLGARVSTGDQPGTSGVGQVGRGPLLDSGTSDFEMSAVEARVSTGDQLGTSGVGQVGRGPLPDSGTSDSDLDSMIGRYIRLNFQMPYMSVLIASYVCFN